jgi:putative transposase
VATGVILGVFLARTHPKESTPMALDQFDVFQLLDALRADDGVDLVRDLVRLVLQELVEAEATEVIGAGRYERFGERLTERNGHRSKALSTTAGDLEVKIPKLRKGSYLRAILGAGVEPTRPPE